MTPKEENKKKTTKNRGKIPVDEYSLILFNDDEHSFDYVTDALIDICNHSYEQAVQCTLITHHNGSCDICKGKLEILKKMKDALTLKQLSTTINTLP